MLSRILGNYQYDCEKAEELVSVGSHRYRDTFNLVAVTGLLERVRRLGEEFSANGLDGAQIELAAALLSDAVAVGRGDVDGQHLEGAMRGVRPLLDTAQEAATTADRERGLRR